MRALVAGDFYPSGRVYDLIRKGEYSSVFEQVKGITNKADLSIVNLECPVTDATTPIPKVGPALRCGTDALKALRYAGFNTVTLANNHIKDFGAEGVIDTLDYLDDLQFDHIGAGRNSREASKTLFKEIAGSTIAVINCCEKEFSVASYDSPGAFELDPVVQIGEIRKASESADFILVIVHGGYERCELPSPRMVRTYRAFIDAGADAVINHHQHCCSGFEVYRGKPVFYGIGNFCFEALEGEDENWNKGVIVELVLEKGREPYYSVIPFTQCLESPSVRLMEKEEAERFSGKLRSINDVIKDEDKLTGKYVAFLQERSSTYKGVFDYKHKLLRGLSRRGLIRPFLMDKERLMLMDYIGCDSHREALMCFLKGEK